MQNLRGARFAGCEICGVQILRGADFAGVEIIGPGLVFAIPEGEILVFCQPLEGGLHGALTFAGLAAKCLHGRPAYAIIIGVVAQAHQHHLFGAGYIKIPRGGEKANAHPRTSIFTSPPYAQMADILADRVNRLSSTPSASANPSR